MIDRRIGTSGHLIPAKEALFEENRKPIRSLNVMNSGGAGYYQTVGREPDVAAAAAL